MTDSRTFRSPRKIEVPQLSALLVLQAFQSQWSQSEDTVRAWAIPKRLPTLVCRSRLDLLCEFVGLDLD